MRIMLEFSTEDGQFQVLYILCLVLLSPGNYILNQLYNLTPLMEKLDARTKMSRKLRLSGDTWKPQHSTQVHLQHIGKTTQVLSLLLNIKELLLELNTLILLSIF